MQSTGNDPDDKPPEVTEPVTPPRQLEPWEIARLTKDEWEALEIPEFLRRTDATLTAPSIPTNTASQTPAAPALDANASVGTMSGGSTSLASVAGATGDFMQFRVDPAEIETKINAEADKRWRNWMPTKTDRKRPRKSWYVRQVRKEYYP